MTRRARLLAVVATLLSGALGTIAATQTWLIVTLDDGAAEPLLVAGAAALPVLTPLSLAAMALGAALSIVGTIVRYVFGAIGLLIAVGMAVPTTQILLDPPVGAYAAAVTEATGIAGNEAIAALATAVVATAWPAIALATQVLLAGASVFTLATARRWRGGGDRRYRAASVPAANGSRPHDAIDDWDELSRGDDPTEGSPHR
jgi:hypothetical protein